MPLTPRSPVPHDIDVEIAPAYAARIEAMLLRDAVRCALESRRLRAPRGVAVTVTDSPTVRRLNKQYLGEDHATDVLSFNTDFPSLVRPDGVRELGMLVIALPAAARSARERGVALADEVALLCVHGTLHLLGYDHETRRDDVAMGALERAALEWLGRPQAARGPTSH